MEPVAPASTALGPSAIAKDWTQRGHPVSRQYVDRLMRLGVGGEKLAGEHVATLDAAWLWRTARTDFLKLSKGGKSEAPNVGNALGSEPAAPGGVAVQGPGGDLVAMLERVRGVELQAFVRWQKAVGYDQAGEAKAYREAAKTRADVEELVASHRKEQGLAADLSDLQILVDQRLAPMRAAIQNIDAEIAKELFPEDPAKYRRRIRSVIARVFVSSRAVAEAKRRLHPSFVHHVGACAA